jgi:hypothetical protein
MRESYPTEAGGEGMGEYTDRKYDMHLEVNGKEVRIKDFVQEVMSGSIVGMVKSLKGTDEPQTIDLTVRIR